MTANQTGARPGGFRHRRVIDNTWHKTACILCENNCGLIVQLDGRHLAKIRGDKDHPGSRGYTCNKALRLDHYQNGGQRLTTPMRRNPDGTHSPVSWETAIREIAVWLRAIQRAHGGESILFYGGGGQGNHLGGAHKGALMHAVGARYSSNALGQEKTGEAWVDAHLVQGHTVGDWERAEVALFIGKNPWQSHGVPRARTVLQRIAKDRRRTMIVIDPVRTETADLADIHLQIRPGTDAWCLAALLGVLVQEDLVDHEFIAKHTTGTDKLLPQLNSIDVGAYAAACGIDENRLRETARVIGRADSVSSYEDLGVQHGPNSTLVSYLHKLIWLLTGNFAKPGAMQRHSWVAPLAKWTTAYRTTPVTGARMLGGIVPCNVIPEEILTDHPRRFRAMWVDSANPAHSLADTQRFADALAALDLVVVLDVAMTETARHADYVLPCASQFEKWEATFFTTEHPHNVFQLRAPLFEPLPGTLTEGEIYSRIVRELGVVPKRAERALTLAARGGRAAYRSAFAALAASDKRVRGLAPTLLHDTLGPTLPEGAQPAALLWGLAQRVAVTHRSGMRRAGHRSAGALFDAMLEHRSGIVFTKDQAKHSWDYVTHPGKRIPLLIPELIAPLDSLATQSPTKTSAEFPFVLAAGQRRSFSANTIFRSDGWRRRDGAGALRLNPHDATRLGLATGATAVVTTARGHATAAVEVDPRMQPGHAILPNGYGIDLPTATGFSRSGVALNTLTDIGWRDEFAGTPWHKHVPARIEPA
ncbi:MAG: molybdopterin-dependent oxidoreductase [Tetrasphaera sp.]